MQLADPGPLDFSRCFGSLFKNNRTTAANLNYAVHPGSVIGKAVTMTSVIAVTKTMGNNNNPLKMYFLQPVVFYVYPWSFSNLLFFLNVASLF